MTTQELPPPFALFRMVTGYYVSQAIYAAAKLGIADLLADGPRSHDALAKATGTATRSVACCVFWPASAFSRKRRTASSR